MTGASAKKRTKREKRLTRRNYTLILSEWYRTCRSFAGSELWIKPIAKINVVVPHYFPLNDSTAFISQKWKRFNRAEVLVLRKAGLLECVDTERKLWMWTHRANVLTRRCQERVGGCLSLEVPKSIQNSIAEHMADHA